jgi:hypothetical protein
VEHAGLDAIRKSKYEELMETAAYNENSSRGSIDSPPAVMDDQTAIRRVQHIDWKISKYSKEKRKKKKQEKTRKEEQGSYP